MIILYTNIIIKGNNAKGKSVLILLKIYVQDSIPIFLFSLFSLNAFFANKYPETKKKNYSPIYPQLKICNLLSTAKW